MIQTRKREFRKAEDEEDEEDEEDAGTSEQKNMPRSPHPKAEVPLQNHGQFVTDRRGRLNMENNKQYI